MLARSLAVVALAAPLTLAIGFAANPPAASAGAAVVECVEHAPGPSPTGGALASFESFNPRRLVDTRNGEGGVDTPIGDGCTLRLDLALVDVPDEAEAIALSVTALGSRPGYLSVFPCDSGLPDSSNLNTRPGGFPTPNLVITRPDDDGDVCFYSLFAADLIVDLTGWWTDDGDQRFSSRPPIRAYDSRRDDGGELVPANTTREIDLSDDLPSGTTAVVANLTVTQPVADGFLIAFPCGSPPTASHLNFRAGESVAVATIVGVSADTKLCVRSNTEHHVIIDLAGHYDTAPQWGPAAELVPVDGERLADSRHVGPPWPGKFPGGIERRLSAVAGVDQPDQATAVMLNIVATQAEAPGFVSVYPCGSSTPETSSVNYEPGRESTNLVVSELSDEGEVCIYTHSAVHLVVDLFGVTTAPEDALAERLALGEYTWPPRTATGADYAVECGTGPLEVALDPLGGVSATLNGVPVTEGTYSLPVATDQITTVRLSRDADVETYRFRCVPDNFPRLDVERPGEPAPGWYLTELRVLAGGTYTVILDHHGAPIWYKFVDDRVIDVRRRSDGRILYMQQGPRFGIDPDDGYRVTSLAGTLIDVETAVPIPEDPGTDYPADHHDYVELPGGGRALLSYPLLPGQDLTVLGADYFADDTALDGVIQEIDANGVLVWSWRTSDYFGYDEVTYPQRFAAYPDEPNGGEVDVFHLNSLDRVDDGSGDYVVSSRHLDAVFRVDRATGDLDWILGSLPTDEPNLGGGTRLEIVGDPLGGPRRTHDARLDGNVLTMFDNRADTGQPARAVAYEIDTDSATATLLWQITEPQDRTSGGLGSNRVGVDGSVLIDWGGALQPMFEEYDSDHQLLLRISQVGGGASYRIVKEPAGVFSAPVLRALAGGTAESP